MWGTCITVFILPIEVWQKSATVTCACTWMSVLLRGDKKNDTKGNKLQNMATNLSLSTQFPCITDSNPFLKVCESNKMLKIWQHRFLLSKWSGFIPTTTEACAAAPETHHLELLLHQSLLSILYILMCKKVHCIPLCEHLLSHRPKIKKKQQKTPLHAWLPF